MMEQYFVRPETVDRIRSSWIGGVIEQYVAWLADRQYSWRSVTRRVPLLMRFGEFARRRGAALSEKAVLSSRKISHLQNPLSWYGSLAGETEAGSAGEQPAKG